MRSLKTPRQPDQELFTQGTAPSGTLVDVAVALPVDGPFTYLAPAELKNRIQPGMRVQVPFKNHEMAGYVVGIREAVPPPRLKTILELLDGEIVLSPEILALTRWVSEYYGAGWGEAIENALPKWVKSGSKAKKALARENDAEDQHLEHAREDLTSSSTQAEDLKKEAVLKPVTDFDLSEEQTAALKCIEAMMESPRKKPVLLQGVTGSGKSEIYIRAIRTTLQHGQSAICLVPEIALTEQIRRFFHMHFGDQLEIVHSRLGDTERFLAWNRIREGRRRVVLGPRSAVFAPLTRLGLILLDEEHEGSYKQDTAPRYHVREVAQKRAAMEDALLVMGSATPSLESLYRVRQGEVVCVELKNRVDGRPLPQVQVIDLKEERLTQKKAVILSRRLAVEIENNLKQKEGTLLLLNRRGFSTHIQCPACGFAETCKSCQVSLTYHQEDGILLCHYCNFRKKMTDKCSDCGTGLLNLAGFGTEKVESEVARRWPRARILRMDADTVRKKGSHEEILNVFRSEGADILIGTQMIAKGFDFPHVTLVGVILADVGLMLPDFRSSERTFQLLTQVAGRAGRGQKTGRVIVQTFSPEHPSIRFAKNHDVVSFSQFEMPVRAQYGYPPFLRLVNVMIRGRDERKAYRHARDIRAHLEQRLGLEKDAALPVFGAGQAGRGIEVIGPAPLPFFRLRGNFRWHVMVKIPEKAAFNPALLKEILKLKKPSGVFSAVDRDPVSIL